MPRKIAIISAVTLTIIMGGWLISLGARGFGPGAADANPAPTAAVSTDASQPNSATPSDSADDTTYQQISDDGDDDQGEHHDQPGEHGDEGPEHEAVD